MSNESEQAEVTENAIERDVMEVDVLIVGGGPAGLSAAIRLRQLAEAAGEELSVVVLEKGSEIGAHILSGAVFDPRALNELLPDWKERGAPLETPVTRNEFRILTGPNSILIPHFALPKMMHNDGNYVISLGNLCRWLGEQAEAAGADIFPGFSGAKLIMEPDENGHQIVRGVVTGDMGLDKNGKPKAGYEPGMELRAKYTLLAEGVRGSLTKEVVRHFHLDESCESQTYGIGIKELWEVPKEKHRPGHVLHGFGWPLDGGTYGGMFLYHLGDNLISVGMVVGLDYWNPHLSPFQEFQRMKTHPDVQSHLEGGKRVSYGARAINEGGWQSIPRLAFPGGLLIGCSAGFVNVPKVKGSHNAMKTGMLGAEAVFQAIKDGRSGDAISSYRQSFDKSWVAKELKAVRNCRPWYHWGRVVGTFMSGLELWMGGRTPWTLKHHNDHESLYKADEAPVIEYPKPDNVLTFDRNSSVHLANTAHDTDQPCHLRLRKPSVPISHNLALFDAPEQRYCPAGVYEIVSDDEGNKSLQINFQNCVHCKTCDIKDPTQNITWTTPEGGGGPNYSNM